MTRRSLLQTLTGAAAATGLPPANAQPKRPNIIFILADDLGYGDLGCYGQKRIRTPHIDRLAAEGMRFTSAYAGSTVCAPSRSCLITGQHTGHTRVRGNSGPRGRVPLRPEDPSAAEVLKKAGYRTAIFGKWGLGEANTTGVPNAKGFEEWFGYLNQGHAHDYYPKHLWHNGREVLLRGNRGGLQTEYSHDLIVDRTLEWIDQNAGAPFFLYLALTIPHANNERGVDLGDGMEVPGYGPYASENWPTTEKGFAAMITRMDRDVGRLIELLKRKGIDENTLVIFTSDNGPHQEGGHDPEFFDSRGGLRGIKRDLYEGGIRVPAIARWPAAIEAGAESGFPWAFWDFLPTAAELAGGEAPSRIDGISIVPTLLGEAQQPREYLYWEFVRGNEFRQAVRIGDWKAVRYGRRAATELYNLREDRAETRDLAGQHPDAVRRAEKLFREARTDSEDFPLPAETS